jgi:hypothetical protein
MCGPSTAEQGIMGQERGFMSTLMGNYNTNFQEQQSVLNHLNGVLQPIIEAGPNQTGFSASEKAALNTSAIDTTGAATAHAERAIANETAGRSDSGNVGEAGNVEALKAGAASAGAGELAGEELGITEADYATGRANFNTAVGAEEGVAGQFNPVGTAGAANEANKNAFSEADTIQQQINQEQADIAGGVTDLAMAGASGGAGAMDGGGFSGFLKGFGGG